MHSLIKGTCAIAQEELGRGQADRIAQKAQKRYEELLEENRSDSKALRAHTYKRIYPGIAVYEAMRQEGIPEEEAVWYIREYFQRYCARVVPHMQRIIRYTGCAKKIPALFLKISVSSFSPEAGFGYEFPGTNGNEARFNIVKCPYYETCRKYGCTEIVKAFCDSDDASCGNMHPKLVWGCTKTIGHGGDCCNFLLQYKEK